MLDFLKTFHLVELLSNEFIATCGLILITARVTTTCGDELVKLLLGTICDVERPFITLLLLLILNHIIEYITYSIHSYIFHSYSLVEQVLSVHIQYGTSMSAAD